MSATIKWGLMAGLLAVVADTLTLVVTRGVPPESDFVRNTVALDTLANVVLFSLAGLSVGRKTRLHRAAAEAGVLAGAITGIAALIAWELLPGSPFAATSTRDVVAHLAWNVALGGILALLAGWIGSRATPSSKSR